MSVIVKLLGEILLHRYKSLF